MGLNGKNMTISFVFPFVTIEGYSKETAQDVQFAMSLSLISCF